jgi:hypothetical protein
VYADVQWHTSIRNCKHLLVLFLVNNQRLYESLKYVTILPVYYSFIRKWRPIWTDRSHCRRSRSENGRNVGGVWSDRIPYVWKCVGSVDELDRSPNTVQIIFNSIYVNKCSRRCYAEGYYNLICKSFRYEKDGKVHTRLKSILTCIWMDKVIVMCLGANPSSILTSSWQPKYAFENAQCMQCDRSDSNFRTYPIFSTLFRLFY